LLDVSDEAEASVLRGDALGLEIKAVYLSLRVGGGEGIIEAASYLDLGDGKGRR